MDEKSRIIIKEGQYELAASITKYKTREQAEAWMDTLPMKYPSYTLDRAKEGYFLLYTTDYGLQILKNDVNTFLNN